MKTATLFFTLLTGVIISGSVAFGQGRSNHRDNRNHDKHDNKEWRGNDRDHRDKQDNKEWRGNDRDHRWDDNRDHDYRRHDDRDYHQYGRRGHRTIHRGNDRYCDDRTVVVHHYKRPRYVYYRDYNVYYDHRRNVYISYSGRSWTMSTSLPLCMSRVNIERTTRWDVDYYDDDFPLYLERRQPSYSTVYSSR